MRITVIACGEPVNQSEILAIERLKSEVQNVGTPPGRQPDDEWILLTNLVFSLTHQFQSEEIDIVAIEPPGVRVVEVKHWFPGWVDENSHLVEQEAEKLTRKARKVATTLRRIAPDLPRVDGTFLLTGPPARVRKLTTRAEVRGVSFYTLNQWKEAIGFDGPRVLTPAQVRDLARALEPRNAARLDGSLRRLAGYVHLQLLTSKDERFHRVYRASHAARRDGVLLHLYDLSADDDSKAEAKARREADTLQRLQLYHWAPRVLDSFQDAPGYPGELKFFTIVDPAAPSLQERATDEDWSTQARLHFAREAVRALREFHTAGGSSEPLVHRNLTPQTILVRYDGRPILTGFDRTRIPSDVSVASAWPPVDDDASTHAPEVRLGGLTAADQRSDVYSLCACLAGLFADRTDSLSAAALEILQTGLADDPEQRRSLDELHRSLSQLLSDSVPQPPLPPARFWTEDQAVRFHDAITASSRAWAPEGWAPHSRWSNWIAPHARN
jgi:hypothetical protein